MMWPAMRTVVVALLAVLAVPALAADPQSETCEQIRARIGQPPLADPDLLRSLSARTDCRFTAAEVYRAAYGDKPLPKDQPHYRHDHRHDDDD
jgi:hypothetical protein